MNSTTWFPEIPLSCEQLLRCSALQEILLKRAADLVEALYGNPHSNQVKQMEYENRYCKLHIDLQVYL